MARKLTALLVGAGLLTATLGAASPDQAEASSYRKLDVATYNVYQGTDLTTLLAAPNLPELVRRAGIAYGQVIATDFPSRAQAIARLIRKERPAVIGLQEVALWKTGPLGGDLTTSYDFLAILLDALHTEGLDYRAAAVDTTFSGTLPISATRQASFTDRDVILVRDGVRTEHAESHLYTAKLVVPTPFGMTFTIPRGWSSVDVKLPGGPVRVANTHLEPVAPPIRNAQAQELHTALAQSPHPVAAVGDFNSLPTDATGPYGTFTGGGYVDSWHAVEPGKNGFTTTQDPDLTNVPSKLSHRVDYVFHRAGRLVAVRAEVFGDRLTDRTPSGLWPSDHAGLVVRLRAARG
ncbi:endonuclease/exonuclease/phosphatase family protein [Streptomyces sp. SPB4]|uniref:endonuclease/exonuclease/phosphatase family protein n=1 Tax=Streptomyces TaxID=1883 RepID=UPI002475DDE7|nr:endonuclease/exonuclease/phosphatase family protein [Streptomyces sp. SPB4]MDH6545309.1 endonuclease/exonuclease/phosphatase family metal-dependent hydrolase [Streptomyces sp. SPB4]